MNLQDLEFADPFESQRLLIRCPRLCDGQRVHRFAKHSAIRAWPAPQPWAVLEPSVDASENQFRLCARVRWCDRRTDFF